MGKLFMLIFLSACQMPGLYTGATTVTSQEGQTLNTRQTCIDADRAVTLFDIAYSLTLHEMHSDGLVELDDQRIIDAQNSLQVCIVEQPEPCGRLGPIKIIGGKARYARKRGCAYHSQIRVSKFWPPICTASWANEPHCIADNKQGDDYLSDFAHEVVNMCAIMYLNYYQKVGDIYKKGGLNQRVKQKFLSVVKE